MKTNTKLVIIFSVLLILIFSRLAIIHIILNNILDNTEQIKDVEAPLELMTQKVIGYDSMLTGHVQLALLNAQKGDYNQVRLHREQYNVVANDLDSILKRDVRILLNRSQRSEGVKNWVDYDLMKLDKINATLMEIENNAFEAMEKRDINKAYSLVVGGDYEKYKSEFYQTYIAWSDIEKEMTTIIRNGIIRDSRNLIYTTLFYSIIIIAVLFSLMVVIRSILAVMASKKISPRIDKLDK